jgi:hypothetical protein
MSRLSFARHRSPSIERLEPNLKQFGLQEIPATAHEDPAVGRSSRDSALFIRSPANQQGPATQLEDVFDPAPDAFEHFPRTLRSAYCNVLARSGRAFADRTCSVNRMKRCEIRRSFACSLRKVSGAFACAPGDVSRAVGDLAARTGLGLFLPFLMFDCGLRLGRLSLFGIRSGVLAPCRNG